MSVLEIEQLCELFRYRWNAPILAELRRSQGCKYVTLRHRLSVADVPLRQSLDFLIGQGMVMRNPGYGHPSRPEYILTEAGLGPAEKCECALRVLKELEAEQIGLNRWTVPVIARLSLGHARFGEIRRDVCAISPRALTITLRELVDQELAIRRVTSDMPVDITYSLAPTGRRIADCLR